MDGAPNDVPFYLNENIFQGAIDLLIDEHILSVSSLLRQSKQYGVTLYPSYIEELLNLKKGTLHAEEKIPRIIQLRQNTESNS